MNSKTSISITRAHLDLEMSRLLSRADNADVEVELLSVAEAHLLAAKRFAELAEELYLIRWKAHWAKK